MKYNIITYKLNKNVKPDEILRAVNVLMQEFSAQYQNCLFRAISLIVEYEHNGVFHSNKTQNAVVRICKSYPHLNAFLKQTSKDKGEGHIDEELSIGDYVLTGGELAALVVIDATEGVTAQDERVAGIAHESGKACIIIINNNENIWKGVYQSWDL